MVEKKVFGQDNRGNTAELITITNTNGTKAEISTLGAIVVSLYVKDKDGNFKDVVLGYDTPAEYLEHTCYFGACVGRNGNRINNAKFSINGTEYALEKNDGKNNLHSGSNGTSNMMWDVAETTENSVALTYLSKDLEQGFPGNMSIKVTYTLDEEDTLVIDYEAKSDKDTVANFTNHSYFNLSGHDSGLVAEQELKLYCSKFTPVDETLIPTGEELAVAGTPMDFTEYKKIGAEIDADYEQLKIGGGYDHNYVVDGEGYRVMAEAKSAKTGIHMIAYTDCPAVQLYAGNFIGEQTGKGGVTYGDRHGFCLESQYNPDAVNQENFASPILKAGDTYRSRTAYQFNIVK